MCGAAVESMLLAAAIISPNDDSAVLKEYRASNGTKKIIDRVVTKIRGERQQALRDSFNIIAYWRNEAAHGEAVPVSEIEAHEALARLLSLSQSVSRHWDDLRRSTDRADRLAIGPGAS
jgi:hypothetical protein